MFAALLLALISASSHLDDFTPLRAGWQTSCPAEWTPGSGRMTNLPLRLNANLLTGIELCYPALIEREEYARGIDRGEFAALKFPTNTVRLVDYAALAANAEYLMRGTIFRERNGVSWWGSRFADSYPYTFDWTDQGLTSRGIPFVRDGYWEYMFNNYGSLISDVAFVHAPEDPRHLAYPILSNAVFDIQGEVARFAGAWTNEYSKLAIMSNLYGDEPAGITNGTRRLRLDRPAALNQIYSLLTRTFFPRVCVDANPRAAIHTFSHSVVRRRILPLASVDISAAGEVSVPDRKLLDLDDGGTADDSAAGVRTNRVGSAAAVSFASAIGNEDGFSVASESTLGAVVAPTNFIEVLYVAMSAATGGEDGWVTTGDRIVADPGGGWDSGTVGIGVDGVETASFRPAYRREDLVIALTAHRGVGYIESIAERMRTGLPAAYPSPRAWIDGKVERSRAWRVLTVGHGETEDPYSMTHANRIVAKVAAREYYSAADYTNGVFDAHADARRETVVLMDQWSPSWRDPADNLVIEETNFWYAARNQRLVPGRVVCTLDRRLKVRVAGPEPPRVVQAFVSSRGGLGEWGEWEEVDPETVGDGFGLGVSTVRWDAWLDLLDPRYRGGLDSYSAEARMGEILEVDWDWSVLPFTDY